MGKKNDEELQLERNAKFQNELELLIARCGGNFSACNEDDKARFADALSVWILTSDDSAAS